MGWIEDHYVHSKVQFKYFGFEWVQLLSPEWMYLLHIGMILGSLGILFGYFYRWSALLFFLTFTYVQLIDASYYLNHYYFVSCVAFLMIFLPVLPTKSKKGLNILRSVPRWTLLALQLQVALVYIYAGLAKINYTWLMEALPLRIWLPAHDSMPIFGSLLAHEWTPWVFAWAGMLYDCLIVFFLCWKKTRWWAFATVVFFHSMVGALFQIGIFPIVMIGAVLIFFDENFHKKVLSSFNHFFSILPINQSLEPILNGTYSLFRSKIRLLFFVFFSVQLLLPWRYLLYDGSIFWNEEGYRFSWRVMLMEKAGTAIFYVKDSETGREGVVNNGDFLCAHQEKQMAMQPDLILQFAHYLGDFYTKKGSIRPVVRVEAYVTLNGAPSRLYIDPSIDLMQVKDGWAQKSWVLSESKISH